MVLFFLSQILRFKRDTLQQHYVQQYTFLFSQHPLHFPPCLLFIQLGTRLLTNHFMMDFEALISANLRQPARPTTTGANSTTVSNSPDRYLVRRQANRMEDLDRRSLSLYNEVAAIKRSLQHLTTQCSSQRLEMELRRAATNILGPIMGSVHDQSRLELERMRNHVSAASSRAEAAYSLAYSARAEVQACQAQQSVPDVRGILQELNVQGGGGGGEHADSGESNRRRSPSRGGVDKQQQSREAMWERIDNHLACHELRLRKSTDQFVRAAINRALIQVEADQGPGENSGGGTRNSTGETRRSGGILSREEAKASGERIHGEGSQSPNVGGNLLTRLLLTFNDFKLVIHGKVFGNDINSLYVISNISRLVNPDMSEGKK